MSKLTMGVYGLGIFLDRWTILSSELLKSQKVTINLKLMLILLPVHLELLHLLWITT